jgi:predicted alpha/beta-hydrolase family hydrolase
MQAEEIPVTFPSGSGDTTLEGIWHLPAQKATNAALIVLHGSNYNKESEPSAGICRGAALHGFTALRFDFRYVQSGDRAGFDDGVQGLDDLIGAFNFFQNFGREMKPTRIYLVGKSLGGVVALRLATTPSYADRINGVAVLGMLLRTPDRQQYFWKSNLSDLKSPLLLVQGEHDPYGSPPELQEFLQKVPVSSTLEIIKEAGHSYRPEPDDPETAEQNMRRVIDLTVGWLEQTDRDRPNFRI